MFDQTNDLLTRGIAAAKANQIDEALYFLKRVLDLDPSDHDRFDALFYLSEITADRKKKREYLEDILVRNPFEARARRKLAILDGKIKESEVIDPDRFTQSAPGGEVKVDASRFICPNCGGKMSYTPDGSALVCEFCSSKEADEEAGGDSEQDFFLAMSTAAGHSNPVNRQTFNCKGCGADFLLPPGRLTITCPYCNSAHVVKVERSLLSPSSIIPMQLDENAARDCLREWFKKNPPEPPVRVFPALGMYFPVWNFTIGGSITWHALYHDDDKWVPENGSDVLLMRDILVKAGSHLPDVFSDEMFHYNLEAVVPYEDKYLADWTAESYQIPVSKASLDARKIALDIERERIQETCAHTLKDLTVQTGGMAVEGFQLLLLPAWVTTYTSEDRRWSVLINGQTGVVRDERKKSGGWLGNLFRW